jgi:Ca2+-binding EF-hand superfamily protein
MLVAEADLNGDGVISIDEFCGMMKRRMMHACEGAKQEELRNIFKACRTTRLYYWTTTNSRRFHWRRGRA